MAPAPVLGPTPTAAVAVVVAAAVALVPALRRDRLADPRRVAVGGGVAYALALVFLRTVVELAFGTGVDPAGLALLAVAGGVILAVQAALPLYLLSRWGLYAPLAGLFVGTAYAVDASLHVGGATDPLLGYVFGVALGVIALSAFAVAIEETATYAYEVFG